MQRRYDQDCPVARTLDLIGDRWTLLIIRDLFTGSSRFNEILANSPGLTPRLLSGRLKFLIDNHLVARELYSEFPPRSAYALTERGRSLFPVVRSIADWGLENLFEGEEETRDEIEERLGAAVAELT